MLVLRADEIIKERLLVLRMERVGGARLSEGIIKGW